MKLSSTEKKSTSYVIRFLMIDHQQSIFNQVVEELESQNHKAMGKLLDDYSNFEKMLNLQWDVIVFNNAYDFDYKKLIATLNEKGKKIPVILLQEQVTEQKDYMQALEAGAYDLINPRHISHLSLVIQRASALSRLIKRENQLSIEVDQLQQQTQTLVETTEYAVAVFQEGIHISVNDQYAKFFGLSTDAFVGLPILDVLQPQNPQQFKQFLKQLSKGDFDKPTLDITCANPRARQKQFELKFSPTEYDEEPALQLVIATNSATHSNQPESEEFATAQKVLDHLAFTFAQNNKVGVVLYILHQFPTHLLDQNWNTSRDYFYELGNMLNALTTDGLMRLSETVYLSTEPTNSQDELNQKLKNIHSQLPKNITVADKSYPVNLRLASMLFEKQPELDRLPTILAKVFANQYNGSTVKPAHTTTPAVDTPVATPAAVVAPVVAAVEVAQPIVQTDSFITDFSLDAVPETKPVVEPTIEPTFDLASPNTLSLSDEPASPMIAPTVAPESNTLSFSLDSGAENTLAFEPTPTPVAPATPSISLAPESGLSFAPEITATPIVEPVAPVTPIVEPIAPAIEATPVAPQVVPVAEQPAVVIPSLSLGEQALPDHDVNQTAIAYEATERALSEQIENNALQLSFQQLYDKEDIDTHIYEITASFTDEKGNVVDLESYEAINHNPALATKLDRWLLVEASKRLHQFLQTSPKARIVVNVHEVSLQDSTLIALLSKLVNLINSKYTRPLILQLREQDMIRDLELSKRFGKALLDNNIGLSVKDFGSSVYSVNLLQSVPMKFARLAEEFTEQLKDDEKLVELQEKLDAFKELNAETQFLIQGLDDMSAFANAWNVDVRYLQGNYFQAKQSNFLDSTS